MSSIPFSLPHTDPTLHEARRKNQRETYKIVGVILTIVFVMCGYFIFWPMYQESQLLKNGLPAQATILEIHPTGSLYNNQPEVRFRLRVQPPSSTAYEVETRKYVNMVYLPQLQPGATVNVRYDAAHPDRVAIE